MKKIMTLILAAGMLVASSMPAGAIEFKAEGEWLMGFDVSGNHPVAKTREGADDKKRTNADDQFGAKQRVRLQLEAVASESLSGTVLFQIGDTTWGKASEGGAVGADGKIVGVLNAFIDFAIPDTELKVRMGLQPLALPNVAGGSAVLDTDSAAAVALSYQFTENVGLGFFWARLLNDNYTGEDRRNYLDNMDLLALTVPVTFDGVEATPWAMLGIIGQNAFDLPEDAEVADNPSGMASYRNSSRWRNGDNVNFHRNGSAYATAFWAGLPVKLSLWDPLNVELDLNYGCMQSVGRNDITRSDGVLKRADTRAEGWLVKGLVEYKMDWGTPGLFAWYGSGDDDNPKNGSERMPAVVAKGNFTSFMGDGNLGWGSSNNYDRMLNYSGTWGVGLQVADMSFLDDLTHTFRVALWNGTNSPSMAKYANNAWAWSDGDYAGAEQIYLTTNDHMLEFNLVNSYQMYENLEVNLELGYIVNMMDHDTWKKADRGSTFEKQDCYKAQLTFAYTF